MTVSGSWFGNQLTEFLRQVALGPQLPLVVLVIIITLQRLAVVLQQGELGANEGQLDGNSTG